MVKSCWGRRRWEWGAWSYPRRVRLPDAPAPRDKVEQSLLRGK